MHMVPAERRPPIQRLSFQAHRASLGRCRTRLLRLAHQEVRSLWSHSPMATVGYTVQSASGPGKFPPRRIIPSLSPRRDERGHFSPHWLRSPHFAAQVDKHYRTNNLLQLVVHPLANFAKRSDNSQRYLRAVKCGGNGHPWHLGPASFFEPINANGPTPLV